MAENLGNDFATTLNGAINGAVTAIAVTSGTGAPAADFRIRIDDELMLVTSVGAGTNWTVVRGVEGTSPVAHADLAGTAHVITYTGLLTWLNENYVQAAASTDNAVARFDGTTGELQNSGVLIDDSNNVTIPGSILGNTDLQIYSSTLSPAPNNTESLIGLGHTNTNTINIAASGTHSYFAGLALFAPTIGAGAGTLTEATTLRIANEPTGATSNYALRVVGGKTALGGHTGNTIGETAASTGFTLGDTGLSILPTITGTNGAATGGAIGLWCWPILTQQSTYALLGARFSGDFTYVGTGNVAWLSVGAGAEGGAGVPANNSTLEISGAPTVGTNKRAVWVKAGIAEFTAGQVRIGGSNTTGKSSANGVLHMEGSSAGVQIVGLNGLAGTNIYQSNGTTAAPTDVVDDDFSSYYNSRVYSGGSWFSIAGFSSRVDGTFTSGQAPPGRWTWSTSPGNASPVINMTLDKDGRLMLGDHQAGLLATSKHGIQLVAESTNEGYFDLYRFTNSSGMQALNFKKSRAATADAAAVAVQDNDYVGGFNFSADDGTDFSSSGAGMYARIDGAVSTGVTPMSLEFWSDGGISEASMTLTSGGSLVLGAHQSVVTATGVADSALQLVSESVATNQLNMFSFYAGSGPAALNFYKSRATAADAPRAALILDDYVGAINFNADDGTNFHWGGAGVYGRVDGTISLGVTPIALDFGAGAAVRMTVSSAGAVLIGTATSVSAGGSAEPLQVKGGITIGAYSADAFGKTLHFLKSRSATVGSFAAVLNGDFVGGINWNADDGFDYVSPVAQISAYIDGAPGSNDTPGRIVFSTTPDGTAGLVERMTLNSAGHLRIGASTTYTSGGSLATTSNTNASIAIVSAANGGSFLSFATSNGTIAAPTNVVSGDYLGLVGAAGYSGGTWFSTASMVARVDGTFTSAQRPPSRYEWWTNVANTASAVRMTLKSTGALLLGSGVADAEITTAGGISLQKATGASDHYVSFKHADVAHGMSGAVATDTTAYIRPLSTTAGGLRFSLYTEATRALTIVGSTTTGSTVKSAAAVPVVDIHVALKSGTVTTSCAANTTLFGVSDDFTGDTKWLVDQEGDTWQAGSLNAAGVGPHAIGGGTFDFVRLALAGAFTSGGASSEASGTWSFGTIIGAAGDTVMTGTHLSTALTTASAQTMNTMAQLWINEPSITLTGGSTLTNAATVYIVDAPTEGTNNYALWVGSGTVRFDGVTAIGIAPSASSFLTLAAGTTALSSMRITSGAAPSSPVEGDVWYDGTNLKFRDSSTSRTISWT